MLEQAVSLHQKGELAKAELLYNEVLAREPKNANALHLLGVLEGQRNNLSAALELIDRAIALDPENPTFFFNRGEVLLKLKRHDDVLSNYDRILTIKPDSVEALFKRGNVLQTLKRFEAAVASYDRALAIKPEYVGALNNRGNALEELHRLDQALAGYDKALAIKPNYSGALYNRGNLLLKLDRYEEALASFDRALNIKPDYAEALDQRGCALVELRRVEEARESFERALAVYPDPNYHSSLIFALNFDPEADAAQHQAERSRWNEQHALKFSTIIPQHTNDPGANRRLRVGYVSSSFCKQAATFAFGGVILYHDRDRFEIFCYSDTPKEDEVTARFRAAVHTWHNTLDLSDHELAELIHADGIDILVDCVGHMRGHRLLVFARKPAPIQVTAWGEPTGTGLKAMDYLLADSVLVPMNERPLLAERVYDLPNFLGYWAPDTLPEPNALPALRNGYVTFGSFNRFAKVQDPVLCAWATILRQVPNSRLLVKCNQQSIDSSELKRIERILNDAEVSYERVTLLGQSDRLHYFTAYQNVDIALDTFPHGGGMTTLDALYMGVPVVTFPGRTISSRLATASLNALGLTDFIAPDVGSYVKLAAAKAGDLSALSRLRSSLRGRLTDSAIGDPARYASYVETAYREMWRDWCGKTKRNRPYQEEAARAIDNRPNQTALLNSRGNALLKSGRVTEALANYDRVLTLAPDNVDALNNRGNALQELGRHEEALVSYDRALTISPDHPHALNNRGLVLQKLKRRTEALTSYNRAIAIAPNDVNTLFNRGNLLLELLRYEEAVSSYDRALAIKPDDSAALGNRGTAFAELKRFREALASYNSALAINPSDADTLTNRGTALFNLDRREEALESFDRVLAMRPDHTSALDGRANALVGLHRVAEAKKSYEQALAIKPNPIHHSNLIFALNFDPEATAALHQTERSRWNELHAKQLAPLVPEHTNSPDPNRRLRVGYVSCNFRHQAATFAFAGAILSHDRRQFEVVCYSDTVKDDDVTAQFRANVEKWHDTATLSDQELSELIYADGIDVLVDCVGHMRGHRLLVFARKPAPIQVTAWGEPTGTGLEMMDYLFADPVLVPMSERSLLAEQVYDLPNFLGYWTPNALPRPTGLPASRNGYVTFGSFNRLAKIQDPVLHSWTAIMRQAPKSRLLLKCSDLFVESNQLKRIDRILNEARIDRARVTFMGASDRANYFSTIQDVDIALDPFPHSGGMTTLDSLWMGVPVIALPGRTISSRLAAASLTALGLTDFIASDVDSYIQLAAAKASDLDALSSLRSTLRNRVANSAFGDAKRYARTVEAAYRSMWRNWCKKRRGQNDDAKTNPTSSASIGRNLDTPLSNSDNAAQHRLPAVTRGKLEFELLRELLGTDAPVILEIGANDGATTANFLSLFPNGTIYAFEPDPRAIEKFRRRIQDPRVHLFEIAVGAEDRETSFHLSSGLPIGASPEVTAKYKDGWDRSGSLRLPKKHRQVWPWVKFESTITVPVRRLDSWAREHDIANVDFIWADVQGAEGDLVAGGLLTLAKTRYFYVEYSNDEWYEGQATLRQLMEMLDKFEVVQRFPMDVLFRNTALRGAERS